MNFYYGIVENRSDPLSLGRCQARVVGLHTHDKSVLPTSDLPWATPMQPISSAAMNGIGHTPVGPVEGTSVIVIFADGDLQQPIIIGTLGGIPSTPKPPEADDNRSIEDDIDIIKTSALELRTVATATSGKQLTLFDKNNPEDTTVTSKLKANMRVFGFNLPAETFIVTIDSGTKITINNNVNDYGENILTFKDPPSNLDAVNQSKINTYVTSGSGSVITDGSGNPILSGSSTQETADKVASTPANDAIPTIPPSKSVSNSAKATSGIKALIAACDKVGLTTKEQKCALLGIAGGESGWIPQQESYNYSAPRLKQIYSFATEDDIAQYSDASKRGLTREQFFSWAYGPTKRGKGFLGNLTDADGGKYYGRGFIQLTGRANYAKYQKMANASGLNIDIVNNPDSLDDDINVSAVVAALYIKDRVAKGIKPTDHPGYFYAAKNAVGVNSPDISARKLSYYEYFYGNVASDATDKSAGSASPEPPKDSQTNADGSVNPGPSSQSQKTGSGSIGFRDPNNKYPLKDYIGEPDTNRLARGIIDGTIVNKKDKSRKITVPKAKDQGEWDQPVPVYGSKYPFNKVFETESGHIQEFDDTPGYERIHTYHRSGTFSEIDPQGTQVNYIVGDNFTIMERNGCVSVSGELNITVEGNTNIFARSDANVQVSNNANIEIGGSADIGIAKYLDLAVGSDINIKSGGSFTVESASINLHSTGDLNILSDGATKVTSSSTIDMLSSSTMNIDYSRGNFGAGASAASIASSQLNAPNEGSPVNPSVPYLIPPERQIEEKAVAEQPEDYNSPEGRKFQAEEQRKEGIPNPTVVTATDESAATGGTNTNVPVDCTIIYTTKDFTNDYRMSKNFTLGMLIDGGVNGKHRLVDQQLSSGNGGGELRTWTTQEIVCNLSQVAQNMLEPMLDALPGGIGGYGKQWKINSGYRLKGVIPHESANSNHCKGLAVDIGILLSPKPDKTFEVITAAEKIVPYDQLILEYRNPTSVWIHAGYWGGGKGLRKMAFTMVNDKTYKRSSTGIPEGFYLVSSIPAPGSI